jgi:very-short-patch-repair endonuclease
MPKAEVVLWKKLREANRNGYNFRRQHPVGPYIADFACLDSNLIVELDGASHDIAIAVARDATRTAFLESRGYRVLRFRNEEIFSDLYRVVDVIMRHVPPPSRGR